MPLKHSLAPTLMEAEQYIEQNAPELRDAPQQLVALDGPPGSPRYALSAEQCDAITCPHQVPPEVAAAGECLVLSCPLRCSLRLLLDRDGKVLQAQRSGIHWRKG